MALFGLLDDAPSIPDPAKFRGPNSGQLIRSQRQENERAFNRGALDQSSPIGSATFTRDSKGNVTGQNVSLSKPIQKIFDPLAKATAGYAGQLPSAPFDPSSVPQGMDLQSNFFNQQMGLLQPGFDEQNRDLEVRAAERGLPIGSESFNALMDPAARAQAMAQQQAAYGAVQLTPQEEQRQLGNALTLRNLPFQEAQSSMGLLNSVPMPNFAQTPQQAAPVNVADITGDVLNRRYGLQTDQYNRQAQQTSDQNAAIGSLLGSAAGLAFAPLTGGGSTLAGSLLGMGA